ncbi:MAG: ParB N-terminal domain-containing protein [Rhodospirillales bacterium]
MDAFLNRLVDDTRDRSGRLRRRVQAGAPGDPSPDDHGEIAAFAHSLEATAAFLGLIELAAAARTLGDALARVSGRRDRDHVAVAGDVVAGFDRVEAALQTLGDRQPSQREAAPARIDSPPAPSGPDRTISLAVAAIGVGARLRRLDEAKVAMLVASIRDIGLQTPISVAADEVDGWRLVAGLHRLEAARRLGHADIPCHVIDGTQPAAQLWEIDENLMRSELTQLERDQHLLRRKQIFDAWRADETGHIAPALGGRSNKGFATDTEERTGIPKRRVNEAVHRASRIAGDVRDAVRTMPAADVRVELDALASLDESEQKLALDRVQRGEAENFRSARAQIRGDAGREHDERAFKGLQAAWRNAGIRVRLRFVRWLASTTEPTPLDRRHRVRDRAPARPPAGGDALLPETLG